MAAVHHITSTSLQPLKLGAISTLKRAPVCSSGSVQGGSLRSHIGCGQSRAYSSTLRQSASFLVPRVDANQTSPLARGTPGVCRHISHSASMRGSAAGYTTASDTGHIYNHPSHRPLEGILVVALEQVISGPYCTRQLADLGATVIKIERPGTGDFVRYHDKRVLGELSSHFAFTNRNKKSLALDIKEAEDLHILKELIKKADVFVQNLVPGAADRYGFSFEELRKTNERLIVTDISGYGSDGPYKTKKAYDLLVQSESGLLSITGTPEEPCKVGCSIADISAGVYAYASIMAALLQRQKTGKGCRIDISMLESMVEWMAYPLYYASDGQSPPIRAGASHASIYPYGPFETGTGKVMLGLQNEREWLILCEKVLEAPELVERDEFRNNTSRSDNRDELYRIICDKFKDSTVEDIAEQLDKAGIANAVMREMKDVWEHPQLKARNRFGIQGTQAGHIRTTLPPGMSGDVEARLEPIPAVGEHTDSILAEFGLERKSRDKQNTAKESV